MKSRQAEKCRRLAAVTWLCAASTAVAAPDCLDAPAALAYWQPIREQAAEFDARADELAPELLGCLGSPDPRLRDGIGYELYARWLRNENLSDATRRALLGALGERLSAAAPDAVLSRSFSALILAELMRSDAIAPFMDEIERQTLLDAAADAIENENDFRGLDADLGWVHPVAHMADLLWRFALHPATTPAQARELLDAVHSKVAPDATAYAFNEPDRLARAVSTLVARELLPAGEIAEWIDSFASPASMDRWSDAFRTPSGMAELHNTKLFLRALSDQLDGAEVDSAVAEALASLVQGFTQLI